MSNDKKYHNHSIEDVFNVLGVTKEGLTRTVAVERLNRYGTNELKQHKQISFVGIFFRQFLSPFVYLLCIAAVISFLLSHQTDAYIILAAVFITIGFGFWQEAKAERTLDALRKLVKATATVVRDGKHFEIDAKDLVPGDLLVIEEGDRISADARLIEVTNLEVNESALTGESLPQSKHVEVLDERIQVSDQENMIFRGTVASRGRGLAIVVRTGIHTELGKIAQRVMTITERKTPLQESIGHLAFIFTMVIFGILGILVVFGIFRGASVFDLLTTSIAIAVAAIPESLVVAVTVILVIGMMRLVKKQALVRKLVSAETLGNTTVICVDKTGTITRGRMSVGLVETGAKKEEGEKFALTIGMLANEGYFEKDGEEYRVKATPTDYAFLKEGQQRDLYNEYERIHNTISDTVPFDSEYKYVATLAEKDIDHTRLYIKGAPGKIIDASSKIWKGMRSDGGFTVRRMSVADRTRLEKRIEELSSAGYRLLAVGYRDDPRKKRDPKILKIKDLKDGPEKNIVFVGFVGIIDPIREDVAETIRVARSAGIRIAMITGDHRLTAQSVAREIGIDHEEHHILDGSQLAEMSDESLREVVSHTSVYSRIVPDDKFRIVKALQAENEVVAMTGDGVNDAPALKQADVGVAMGSGQDVAKEAADLIILDDRFTTIVGAVKEGRVILDNIRKVVLYLLKDTFSEIILLGTAIVAGLPLPILAAQVLWINIVEDALPAFALSYEPAEKDVMKLKPEGKGTKLLTKEMNVIIFVIGLTIDILLLSVYLWFSYRTSFEIEYIRTLVFTGLALNSLIVIFGLKSLRQSVLTVNIFDNMYMIGSVIFGFAMLLVAMYVPFVSNLLQLSQIQLSHWMLLIGIAFLNLVLVEITKWLFTHESARFRVQ